MSDVPSREDALAIMHEYTASDSLRKHMLAVEAAMRAYAGKFGEDSDRWGITGLVHDFDYERWPEERIRSRYARARAVVRMSFHRTVPHRVGSMPSEMFSATER